MDRLAAATSIVTGTADALVYNGGCASGAAVVLMDHFAPEECCSLMAAERVSVIPLVPTMMARILAMPDLSPYDLHALRIVINHGSSLPGSQGEEVEKKLGCRIVQAYGSVDCGGISATCWNDPQEVRLGTLGRPLDGNEIRIVDSDDREIPPGEVGRLLVRGLHTDARFLNNPELDAGPAKSKVTLIFRNSGRRDERGKYRPDGTRARPHYPRRPKYFPADVEATLSQHPKIMEVAVVGFLIRRWAKGSAPLWFAATEKRSILSRSGRSWRKKGWLALSGRSGLKLSTRFRTWLPAIKSTRKNSRKISSPARLRNDGRSSQRFAFQVLHWTLSLNFEN